MARSDVACLLRVLGGSKVSFKYLECWPVYLCTLFSRGLGHACGLLPSHRVLSPAPLLAGGTLPSSQAQILPICRRTTKWLLHQKVLLPPQKARMTSTINSQCISSGSSRPNRKGMGWGSCGATGYTATEGAAAHIGVLASVLSTLLPVQPPKNASWEAERDT